MSMMALDFNKDNELDMKVIREILSSEYRIKIFLAVKKKTKPDGRVYLTGYRLAKIASVSPSTAYKWMERLVQYGVFEYPGQIDGIKRVKITKYGIRIYEKIKLIFPKIDVLYDFK